MAKELGGNKEIFKRKNRGLLLKFLATGQCASRIELARRMGLSKMAITNMVSELMDMNVIAESFPEQNDELGRNPILLRISPDAPKAVGVLIMRDRFEAVLCDLSLKILRRETMPVDTADERMLLSSVCGFIDNMLNEKERIVGIGVASVGPVDVKNGMILNPKFFYDIKNVPIVKILTERYHLPVAFDNDNQCGVLAEKLYGNGKDFQDIILLGISQGVGCGIVSDGRLFSSGQKLIPEFGHVSIDLRGNSCVCGNRGCIETYISTPILLKRLRDATGLSLSFREFCLMSGDQRVDSILSDAVDKLSVALISSVNLMNAELILMGHDGAYYPDRLLKQLEERINKGRFADNANHIYVKRPHFMNDAQLLGGACRMFEQVFQGNYLFD